MKTLNYLWSNICGRAVLLLVALVGVALIAAACGGREETASSPAPAKKPTIRIVDTQFESGWINNAIAKFVIEKGYGYPVETVEVTTVVGQASLAKGDLDLNMELWQQNNINWYNEETAKGNLINLGVTYEGGPQFFIIPQWVANQYNIKTVEDMKRPEVVQLFRDPEDPKKGAFINCIIGWNCDANNRAKFKAYGLDQFYNLISPGTGAALDAALAGAQTKKAPVFGYYWSPTSLMGAYDWYILEEPRYTGECWAEVIRGSDDRSYTPKQACAYETLPVEKGIHKGMLTKAPDVVEMLRKMNVGLEPLNRTAAWAVENDIQGHWDKAAGYYLKTYEERWTQWMPADNVEKVKEALATAS